MLPVPACSPGCPRCHHTPRPVCCAGAGAQSPWRRENRLLHRPGPGITLASLTQPKAVCDASYPGPQTRALEGGARLCCP